LRLFTFEKAIFGLLPVKLPAKKIFVNFSLAEKNRLQNCGPSKSGALLAKFGKTPLSLLKGKKDATVKQKISSQFNIHSKEY